MSKHLKQRLPGLLLGAVVGACTITTWAQVSTAERDQNVDRETQAAPVDATERDSSGENRDSSLGSAGDSPLDYEASEQISEDLPVSFPVDI